MFDSAYEFTFVGHQPSPIDEDFERVLIYKFHSDREKYILRAEQFKYKVFAIKFYPKSLEKSPDRYKKLTHEGKPWKILGTCLKIMVDIYQNHPDASFGFLASNLLSESETSNTKRFRVYGPIMKNFFSPRIFSHRIYEAYSVYLLINKKYQQEFESIKDMFFEIFAWEDKP